MVDKDDIDLPEDEWGNYEEGVFRDPNRVGPDALPGYTIEAGWEWDEKLGSGAFDEEYQAELAREYAQLEEKAREEAVWSDVFDRVSAEIGDLKFEDAFSNPDVDVVNERQTAEHEIVSGGNVNGNNIEFAVQTLGSRPPEITVTGWVTEDQLQTVDELTSNSFVEMVTDRWTGTAVPVTADTPYERAVHEKYGRIFEVTITLLGIERGLRSEEEDSESSEPKEITTSQIEADELSTLDD